MLFRSGVARPDQAARKCPAGAVSSMRRESYGRSQLPTSRPRVIGVGVQGFDDLVASGWLEEERCGIEREHLEGTAQHSTAQHSTACHMSWRRIGRQLRGLETSCIQVVPDVRVLGTQSILLKPFDISMLANAVAKALPEPAALT